MELLREHLGVRQWQLFGGSWGSTLSLVYAERYPRRVSEIVLVGITMGRKQEFDWLVYDLRALLSEQWYRFRDGVPEAERDGDLLIAYKRLLDDPDPDVRARAADTWCAWEQALVSLDSDGQPSARWNSPRFRYAFARLVVHYFLNRAFIEEGAVLANVGALAGIPGVLVHGTRDISAPMISAWDLSQAWPEATLVPIARGGHTSDEPEIGAALIAATDRFRPA